MTAPPPPAAAATFRPIREADAPALVALGRGLNLHQGDPTEHLTEQAIRRLGFGADPAFHGIVAELDGRVVGYALFQATFESGWAQRGLYLSDLWVEPGVRRHGIGRGLVAAVVAEARRRDASFLWWAVRPWNEAARGFYRSLGAVEEPMIACALTFEAFDRLAEAGARLTTRSAGDP
jgi:ribosomal protein S18 acetylase RimI-like enzyme